MELDIKHLVHGCPANLAFVHATLTAVTAAATLLSFGAARRPKSAVLGSRQQMCQHPTISKLPAAAGNQACRAATKSRSCAWCAARAACPPTPVAR